MQVLIVNLCAHQDVSAMKLFPPQQDVIDAGILDRNQHCLLCMATGSGKTYLSELAIERVVQSGFKAIYLTPLRALASQQYDKWRSRFPEIKTGVFTGETLHKDKTRGGYSSQQILLMTPERLDACLRNWRSHWNWIPDVGLLVVDEFHIIGQEQRGPRLEGSITRLVRLNPFVRIIGLSATMPNVNELADWLQGASFSSQWRQVPLQKRIIRYSSAKDKLELLLPEIKRCVDAGGQSFPFRPTRP